MKIELIGKYKMDETGGLWIDQGGNYRNSLLVPGEPKPKSSPGPSSTWYPPQPEPLTMGLNESCMVCCEPRGLPNDLWARDAKSAVVGVVVGALLGVLIPVVLSRWTFGRGSE